MLPRPSRLKSLASELSPVLTTPPPVEPNTVFVLMSVPEMMLSSKRVVLRRRAATMPAIPASRTSAPPPIAQVGVLPNRSSMNDGSGLAVAFFSALASGALVSGGGDDGALVSGAGDAGGDVATVGAAAVGAATVGAAA